MCSICSFQEVCGNDLNLPLRSSSRSFSGLIYDSELFMSSTVKRIVTVVRDAILEVIGGDGFAMAIGDSSVQVNRRIVKPGLCPNKLQSMLSSHAGSSRMET